MFNIGFFSDYLRHRFKATNRHGLHSPFVYRLVDKVIYDFNAKKVYPEIEKLRIKSKKNLSTKVDQLIYRLVTDLQPSNLAELGSINTVTRSYLQKAVPEGATVKAINDLKKLDCAIIAGDNKKKILQYFNECLPKVHETSMLIITDIYRNDDMKRAWATIKAHPQVIVTVDLFWIGLVFFRKGQVREDFWIKFV